MNETLQELYDKLPEEVRADYQLRKPEDYTIARVVSVGGIHSITAELVAYMGNTEIFRASTYLYKDTTLVQVTQDHTTNIRYEV